MAKLGVQTLEVWWGTRLYLFGNGPKTGPLAEAP